MTDSQQTIKKTLLRALALWSSRALEDSEIEIARLRIEHLIRKFEECHANIDCAASCNLWRRLRAFAFGEQRDTQLQVYAASDVGKKKMHQRRPAIRSDTRTYDPGEHRMKLPTVEHRPSEPKVIRCDRCYHELVSCWYFVHPRTSRATVLVPSKGHISCKGEPSGSRAFFKPVDGSNSKCDNELSLDYCVHNCRRAVCAPCGGSNICRHRKPKWRCAICKLTIRKRVKKVIPAHA